VTKMTKTAELRDLSVEDLRAKAKELDDQGFRLRLQKAMGQLESPIRLRTTRREVARIKTIIRQKEQA
jgi:large subunit ribosomal protein L29